MKDNVYISKIIAIYRIRIRSMIVGVIITKFTVVELQNLKAPSLTTHLPNTIEFKQNLEFWMLCTKLKFEFEFPADFQRLYWLAAISMIVE